jgi:glutamine synthetase
MADGIEARAEPPPPVSGSAYAQSGEPLPASMRAAMDLFQFCQPIVKHFGERYQDMFYKLKKAELAEFENRVSDLEYQSYL